MNILNTDGTLFRAIDVDDSSNLATEIMAVRPLTLNFSLPDYVDFPVGCTAVFDGRTYTMRRKPKVTKHHSRSFEYVMEMYSEDYALLVTKMRHVVIAEVSNQRVDGGDGRLAFPLTATPKEHLQMVVDNLNVRDTTQQGIPETWKVGKCLYWDDTQHTDNGKGKEKLVSYDYAYLNEALSQIAEAFEVEWWVDATTANNVVTYTLNLGRMEFYRDAPLPMSYGMGNGFKSGVSRTCQSDRPPVTRMFVQGGDRNIDPATYGNNTLRLPPPQSGMSNARIAYDGERFYAIGDEPQGCDKYQVSADRQSIFREGVTSDFPVEDTYDGTEIYPQRVGTVTKVDVIQDTDEEGNPINLYDIYDNSQDMVDYSQCSIPGQTMTIVFQSGQLAGREFDLNTLDNGTVICATTDGHPEYGRRMELCPTTIDGQVMPSSTFPPAVGDKYIIFNCKLPEDHYHTDSLDGAEWELFKQAVIALYEREREQFTFSGEVDGIWAKAHWNTSYTVGGVTYANGISDYMRIGSYVKYSDEMYTNGILLRVTAATYPVNRPKMPSLTLSNALAKTGFNTKVRKLVSRDVVWDTRLMDQQQNIRRMELPAGGGGGRSAGGVIRKKDWYTDLNTTVKANANSIDALSTFIGNIPTGAQDTIIDFIEYTNTHLSAAMAMYNEVKGCQISVTKSGTATTVTIPDYTSISPDDQPPFAPVTPPTT